MITIGSNQNSLVIQGNLSRASKNLASAFERLSSGQRINGASDDAVGLAIAHSLKTDSRILSQSLRNINDATSVQNISSSAIGELTQILDRMVELAEQSANGTYQAVQREALDKEFQASKSEYKRIVASTEFNGVSVLQGGSISVQDGTGTNSNIQLQLADLQDVFSSETGSVGTGAFAAPTTSGAGPSSDGGGIVSIDYDGDGDNDIVRAAGAISGTNNLHLYTNNGSGGFTSAGVISAGAFGPNAVATADFDNNGDPDLVSAGYAGITLGIFLGGTGTTFSTSSITVAGASQYGPGGRTLQVGDFDGDGNTDIVASHTGANTNIILGNGDGTFKAVQTFARDAAATGVVAVLDYNRDGKDDLAFGTNFGALLYSSNGDGTFATGSLLATEYSGENFLDAVDINGDGFKDLTNKTYTNQTLQTFISTGAGTFSDLISANLVSTDTIDIAFEDINRDGFNDFVNMGSNGVLETQFGSASGTFSGSTLSADLGTPSPSEARLVLADFNNDGVPDSSVNAGGLANLVSSIAVATTGTIGLQLSVSSVDNARLSLTLLTPLQEVHGELLGRISSTLSRLEAHSQTLAARRDNFEAAASKITDIDTATEVTSSISAQIRQQANVALLGQANQAPKIALSLLGGA